MRIYKKLFSKATMLLTISGFLLNIILVWFANVSGVPFYFDSIGTVITAALGGVLPGIAVGFFSNIATSLISVTPDPMTMYYAFLNVFIGVAAGMMSKRGWFGKWSGRLGAVGIFAVIGGALGSVVTWVLYGFSFGQGISAPLANFLFTTIHFSQFAAQFAADMGIDIGDKLITVICLCLALRLLPGSIKEKLPLGAVYIKKDGNDQNNDLAELRGQKLFRRRSLRTKITLLILIFSVVLSSTGLAISCAAYKSRLTKQYSQNCGDIVTMMLAKIDGDRVEDYFLQGESAQGYKQTEDDLYDILNNALEIKYMYVYQIKADGCGVVFDLDSADGLEGEDPGTVLPFDKSFPYIEETIAGKEIPPLVTDDTYGWLLTVYKPVKNSEGKVKAYAAADIDMRQIRTDMYSFGISIASLLFGVMVIITAVTLWYCDKRLLVPMSVLAEQARNLDFNGENADNHVRDRLSVNTGDEIEEVFHAMCRTEDAIEENIVQIKEKNLEISYMQRNIIYTLANMVENRDGNTGGHIKRTAGYVRLIGQKLYDAGLFADTLNNEYIHKLYDSAPLHDIGKVKIPDAILNKPGKLTTEEFDFMKTHTTEGADILRQSLSDIEDDSWLSMAVDMARHHHERWDGKGYPDGLSGDDIPLCARIMAVSDVFDALVSARSYKIAYAFEESMNIIREGAGTQFDARIVDVFLKCEKEIREIMGHN